MYTVRHTKTTLPNRRVFIKQSVGWLALVAATALTACQLEPSADAPTEAVSNAAPQPNAAPSFAPMSPLPLAEAAPPVALTISAIGLAVDVAPMVWEIVNTNGERSTQWRLPDGAAGWHSDSAGAGAAGNVIISGRQHGEGAVFAPLALGAVEPGQWVQLRGADDATFVYQITEVAEPIPLEGATPAQMARQSTLYAVGNQPRLTLITGWPAFTTTHRLFVTAEFRGRGAGGG
ncbi:MAG: class F sortase [Caldilineaceae bacterium]